MFLHRNVLILTLVALLAGLLTLNLGVLFTAHALIFLACAIDTAAAPSPQQLRFTREGAASLKLGENVSHQLIVQNTGRRKIRAWIRDCWPPSAGIATDIFPITLQPNMSATVDEVFTTRRRGTRCSEFIAVRTLGPLHLAGRQRSFATDWQLQVLPAFSARKHLPSRILRLREMEGRSLLLVRGAGTEFDSLREYVAGDDVRAIDWRSSARLGQTLVRTWRPERDRKVVILLDSGRAGAMRIGRFPVFDDYIETALLLTALAQKAGDSVDAYALDTSVRAQVRLGADPLAMHKLAAALTDVAPILSFTDWQLAATQINRNAKNAALVVILTDIGLSSISDGLLRTIPQLAARHRVIIATAAQPNPTDFPDLPRTADTSSESQGDAADSAAQSTQPQFTAENDTDTQLFQFIAKARTELARKEIRQQLTMLGAKVIAASPENLPVRVADTYIELKTRGKL